MDKTKNKRYVEIVRYADDFIVMFQYENEAKSFYEVLKKRLSKFNLELEESKTRIIPFGRLKGSKENFDFLGFTHINAKTRKGKYILKHKTSKKKMKAKRNLKISNMLKNHHIAKSLQDSSLSLIIRQLTYKAKWEFKKIYKIETFYPSSQICSHCDYKNEITKDLNIREYVCRNCHTKLDRDINASENIMLEGLKLYMKELLS